jgi:protein-S-isoprenylcysteine O-methyltransferase Ste14
VTTWPLAGLALASFLLYGHAIRRLFSRAAGVDPRMRMLQSAGTVAAALHLWALSRDGTVPIVRWAAGAVLYLAGLALFRAAREATREHRLTLAFSRDEPLRLLEEGVYRFLRHPFYTAYSLSWAAGVVLAPSWETTISASAMWALYAYAALEEEGKFLGSPLHAAYTKYRQRTGPFWPRVGRLSWRPRVRTD